MGDLKASWRSALYATLMLGSSATVQASVDCKVKEVRSVERIVLLSIFNSEANSISFDILGNASFINTRGEPIVVGIPAELDSADNQIAPGSTRDIKVVWRENLTGFASAEQIEALQVVEVNIRRLGSTLSTTCRVTGSAARDIVNMTFLKP